jgi:hypothetical protein
MPHVEWASSLEVDGGFRDNDEDGTGDDLEEAF